MYENTSASSEFKWILKVETPTGQTPFEFGHQSREEAIEWHAAISEMAQRACQLENQHRELERTFKIAKEISNLIIYCRSITFNLERAKEKGFIHYEMSSFIENKAERLICQTEKRFFLNYHQVCILTMHLTS